MKTLTELRLWNVAHQRAGAIKYGQALLDISDEMDVRADRARYEADREKDIRLSATDGIDAVMKAHQLDALLFPGVERRGDRRQAGLSDGHRAVRLRRAGAPAGGPGGGAERRDGAGGGANRRFPAGFDPKPSPYGVSFTGMACSEPKLIETRVRVRAGDEAAGAAEAVTAADRRDAGPTAVDWRLTVDRRPARHAGPTAVDCRLLTADCRLCLCSPSAP